MAHTVKNLPAMWETWIWSLSWEDPLEKEMATHCCILAWIIPWTEDSGRLQCMGLQRDMTEQLTLSDFHFHISDFKVYKIFSLLLCVLLSHHYAWLKIMVPLSQKRTAQCQQSTLEWIDLFSACNCPSLLWKEFYYKKWRLPEIVKWVNERPLTWIQASDMGPARRPSASYLSSLSLGIFDC